MYIYLLNMSNRKLKSLFRCKITYFPRICNKDFAFLFKICLPFKGNVYLCKKIREYLKLNIKTQLL